VVTPPTRYVERPQAVAPDVAGRHLAAIRRRRKKAPLVSSTAGLSLVFGPHKWAGVRRSEWRMFVGGLCVGG
jgi:hypothetical protein